MNVILASGSPRRHELLGQLGFPFMITAPDIDETPRPGENPVHYVRRVALAKALAVEAPDDALVIAAERADEATRMLAQLSGRTHRVHTGVAMRRGDDRASEVVTSLVTFTTLTPEMIEWYVATGEPLDKAGAYAVQGIGGVFVQRVHGSVSNVVGLPMHTVVRLAGELGVTLVG